MKKNKPAIWIVTIFVVIIVITSSMLISNLNTPTPPQTTPTYPVPTKTQPSPTPYPTLTPDPCSPNNLPAEIEAFHKLMRRFDDTYLVAENTPVQSLTPLILEMQEIRREAEDYVVPDCITDLKDHMLAYMNTVIETFITLTAFTSRGDSETIDQEIETINQGIERARSQHDTYVIELSRLMGWTLVPTPSTPNPNVTLSPSE